MWPLTARGVELDAAVRALGDAHVDVVAISGPAGVGKTRLAEEVLADTRTSRRHLVRALAGPALGDVPFGAVAHLLPRDALEGESELSVVHLFDLVRRQLDGRTERTLLFVDDVPHLDHPSVLLVLQLVNAGLVQLLLTRRDDEPVPAGFAPLARSDRWVHLELGPFGPSDVAQLLREVLGGPVHAGTLREIMLRTEGNAMYVRDLVEGAVRSGALVCADGTWVLVRPLAGTRRLRDHVAQRVAELDRTSREVAELLSLCQPIDVSLLVSAGWSDALADLERRGLATVGDTGSRRTARLVHPLFAEVLAEQVPETTRLSMLAAHADRLGADVRPDDQLRVTLWKLAAGRPLGLTELRQALGAARSGRDFRLVERLALAARAVGAGDEVIGPLGDALYELGEFELAAAHVAAALGRTSNEFEVLELALALHRIQLWGLNQPDEALATLEEASARVELDILREAMRVVRANVLAYSSRPVDALAVIGEVTSDIPAIVGTASVARAASLVQVGRTAEAEALSRSTYDDHRSLAPGSSPIHPALHLITRSFALCEFGRLDEAVDVATAAYESVVDDMVAMDQVWSALNAARAELFSGHLDAAQHWAREALAVTRRTHFATGERLALTVLACALGQAGDAVGAAAVAARLVAAPPDARFLRAETAAALAWASAAGSTDHQDAVDILHRAAGQARDDMVATSEMMLLHEAARLGDRTCVDRLAHLATVVEGPLAAMRAGHARALREMDPEGLRSVAAAAESCGARLVAAELHALAASLDERRGDRRSAAAARRSAARLLTECGGARTPALEALTLSALSDRERQVVRMAADGMASKEIADRLHLSVRTVENHLQRSYTKLGISSRAELQRALVDQAGTAPT